MSSRNPLQDVLRAYGRALRSLTRRALFWHLLWPGLTAFLLWAGIAFYFWMDAVQAIGDLIRGWPVIGPYFAEQPVLSTALTLSTNILLLFVFIPLVSVTSAVIVSTFALPFMLERVAKADYPELEMREGGSLTGSIVNATFALLAFAVLALLSLPLWIIPGLGLLIPLTLSAWMNQRCYRYDALMNHASAEEMRRIIRRHRGRLMFLGMGASAAAFIPFANLVVPAFTGLAFVHFLLEALRQDRSSAMARPGRSDDLIESA